MKRAPSPTPATPPTQHRLASLFREGSHQAVRIPREFELPGTEVRIFRDGDRLVLEPLRTPNRPLAVLAELGPVDEELSDADSGMLPLDGPEM